MTPDVLIERLRRAQVPCLSDPTALLHAAEQRGFLGGANRSIRIRRTRLPRLALVGAGVLATAVPVFLWWFGQSESSSAWLQGFVEHSRAVIDGLSSRAS